MMTLAYGLPAIDAVPMKVLERMVCIKQAISPPPLNPDKVGEMPRILLKKLEVLLSGMVSKTASRILWLVKPIPRPTPIPAMMTIATAAAMINWFWAHIVQRPRFFFVMKCCVIVCSFYDGVLFRNSESELEGSQNLGRLQPWVRLT